MAPKQDRQRARRRAFDALGGLGGSQVSLQNVLKRLKDLPAEALQLNRYDFQRQQAVVMEMLGRQISLEQEDGGEFVWELLHPGKLLAKLMEKPALQRLFRRALELKPVSMDAPWSLVIGFDEYVPGSQRNVQNHRKAMVLSYSFLELGEALREEAAWMTPVVLRSDVIARTTGGWSHCYAQVMRLMLLDAEGFATSGVPLSVGGQDVLMFAKVRNNLSDGDGLRAVLDWRGANAIKPCFKHGLVVSKRCGFGGQGEFVDITCTNHAVMRAEGVGYMEELQDILLAAEREFEAGNLSAARYSRLGMASGFWANAKGALAALDLRPHLRLGETGTFDWVHTELQGGILTVEMYLFIQACEGHGVMAFGDLESFLKFGWAFPGADRRCRAQLWRVFDEHRSRSCHQNERLKLNSSELLGIYGLFRHFVETKIGARPEVARERDSLQKCFIVVDLLLDAKRGTTALPDAVRALRRAHAAHMNAHMAVYGTGHIIPKHHWMWDVFEQMLRDPLVLDAFVIERAHLRVKRVADNVDNTRTFERSVLVGLAMHCAQCLEDPEVFTDGLRGLQAPLPEDPHIRVGDRMSINNLELEVGDIVFVLCNDAGRGNMGKIVACLLEDNLLYAVVKELSLVRQISRSSALWRFTGGHALVLSIDIEQVNAWYFEGEDVVVLLK